MRLYCKQRHLKSGRLFRWIAWTFDHLEASEDLVASGTEDWHSIKNRSEGLWRGTQSEATQRRSPVCKMKHEVYLTRAEVVALPPNSVLSCTGSLCVYVCVCVRRWMPVCTAVCARFFRLTLCGSRLRQQGTVIPVFLYTDLHEIRAARFVGT